METRNPLSGELPGLCARISRALGYREDEPGVERDFPQLYDPRNLRHLWVAQDAGGIGAHAGFFPAELRVEGLPLPVAGIGGVFTEERLRGQGIASSLINKCCEEAGRGGAALALLWSDRHEFYAKLGFHLVGRQWCFRFRPEQAALLRTLGEKAGIPASVLEIRDEPPDEGFFSASARLCEQLPVGIARSPELHRQLLGSGACRVLSAWAGGELAAYFAVGKGHDLRGYVHEWAGEEGALHQLMAACLERQAGPLQLLSPQLMPEEAPWIYALEAARIPHEAGYLALVRLLDPARLGRLLDDYLFRAGLQRGQLRIEREGARFSFRWGKAPPELMSEAELLGRLFGPTLPSSEEQRAFLPLRLWYWGMDSV